MSNLEIGRPNKLPHYSVIGEITSFYIWVNEDGKGSASEWVKGSDAFDLYHRLAKLRNKDKKEFICLAKEVHLNNKKVN